MIFQISDQHRRSPILGYGVLARFHPFDISRFHPRHDLQTQKMPASNFTDHNGKCFHALIQQFLQVINIFNNAETQTKGSDFAVWKIGFRWFRILGRSGIIDMCYPGPIHPLVFLRQTTERMVKMPASNFRNHSRYCYYVPIQLFYQAISIFSNAGTVVEQYNFRVWKIGFPPRSQRRRLTFATMTYDPRIASQTSPDSSFNSAQEP